MNRKKWKSVATKSTALVVLLAAMVLSYQNCGKAGFDEADFASEEGATEIDSKLANLPFPYEVTVNQAAFMSCQFNGVQDNANTPYFSFKVGAYNNDAASLTGALTQSQGGLSVRQEFVDEFNQVAQAFNPNFRSTKYKEALTLLPSVSNTRLQLSLRQRNYPQNTLLKYPIVGSFGGGSMTPQYLLSPISGDTISEVFKAQMGASEQPVYNYFQTAELVTERSLAGSLLNSWGSSGDGMDFYGPLIGTYNNSYLTVGFAKDEVNLSTPGGETEAYGKGLKPDISFYSNVGYGQSPVGALGYAMTGISEYNLETGYQSGGQWRCSDTNMRLMAFKIVRFEDRFQKVHRRNNFSWPNVNAPGAGQTFNGTCPSPAYPDASNPNMRQDYMIGEYCPSPENPNVFGRPLREFPVGNNAFACPAIRQRLLPTPTAAQIDANGQPAEGTQLNSGNFHARGRFCLEQYEYACPAEPMYRPTVAIPGQPPLSENAYLTSSPEKLAIYHALRRFLPESQWDINVSKRCIVERAAQSNVCYKDAGPLPSKRPVIYDEFFFTETVVGGRDQVDPIIGRHSGCGPNHYGDCPAYMTLCVRQ